MAILKALSQINREPAKVQLRLVREDVRLSADEIERRAAMVAAFKSNEIEVLPTIGKPLRAQKWYQPDYRVATPKGLVLKSAVVRGNHKRWAVK